jgi:hypothetical protein
VRIPAEQPDAEKPFWTILIDGGNALNKQGGDDHVLLQAMRGIRDATGGRVDLYIMTHEHMDHVQGPLLLHGEDGKDIRAERVWMTASAQPSYYDSHPDAARKPQLAREVPRLIDRQKLPLAAEDLSHIDFVLALNSPRETGRCVTYIAEQVPSLSRRLRYVHADRMPRWTKRQHGVPGVEIEVWAPEEDTSVYYGRFRPLTLAPDAGAGGGPARRVDPTPPPGVGMADFYRLVGSRDSGLVGNALMIDKAGNNSSIVFLLTWKGRRLLFAADAEERSWQHIRRRVALSKVDFLKVSHHGSRNGTPPDLLDDLLGPPGSAALTRTLVSTAAGQYPGVPDDGLLADLRHRSELHDTRDVPGGEALILMIPLL